ncbi:MAG TPA: hypothetical protein VIY86_02000, partial [Pirellulaceae bacterium]
TREEFLQQLLNADPPSVRKLNPAISTGLAAVIHRAIEKNPARRYATAQELADDLNRFLDGRKTQAESQRWMDMGRRWVERHRRMVLALVACLAVSLVAVVAAAVLISREQSRTAAALREARDNFERAEHNLRDARLAVDDFGLRMSDQLAGIPGAETVRREMLLESLRYYESFLRQAASDRALWHEVGKTHLKAGRIHEQLGETDRALSAYDAACRVLAAVDRGGRGMARDLAQAHNNRGLLLARTGDSAGGLAEIQRALEQQRQLRDRGGEDWGLTSDLACSLCNRALLLETMDQASAAREALDEALTLQRQLVRILSSDSEAAHRLAIGLNHMSALIAAENGSESVKLVREACDWLERLVQRDPADTEFRSDLALSYNNLAASLVRQQDVRGARANYQRAKELLTALVANVPQVPSYRSDLAVTANNLGRTLLELNQPDSAQREFRFAQDLLDELLENFGDQPDLLGSLSGLCFNQGIAYYGQHDAAAGQASFDRAIEYGRRACAQAPQNAKLRRMLNEQIESAQRWKREAQTVPRDKDSPPVPDETELP